MFSMGISALDLEHLIKFCEVIGFNYRKLRYERRTGRHNLTARIFYCYFSNNEFCENLIKSCFPENGKTSDNLNLRFSYWIFSDKRFTMAMLLGFFDGDGSHHMKFANERNSGEKRLTPEIKIKSRICLEDIKKCFNIKYNVENAENGYNLTLEKELFNELLLNYDKSLKRKRYSYKILDSINYWEISKKLLKEGWSLEEIYFKKFGFSFKPENHRSYKSRLITHFKNWFANDPSVFNGEGKVSIRKIIEVYGKLENNPLVIIERDRIISRRREGWSLEKIYTEELGYVYYPSDSTSRFRMREKFKEVFKDDPLIMGYEDILKKIEEVYNSNNKL